MRCLYCGKGLPLLQRLRRGGEFCSDAHRLKYQEEYNQLALSRLLQAQTLEEPAKAPAAIQNGSSPNGSGTNGAPASGHGLNGQGPKGSDTPAIAVRSDPPAPVTAPPARMGPVTAAPASATAAATTIERSPQASGALEARSNSVPAGANSVKDAAKPAPPVIQAPAPQAGFVPELPLPQQPNTPALVIAELELTPVVRPEQPRREASPMLGEPPSRDAPPRAGALAIGVSCHAADSGPVIRVTGVEVRESGRTAPVTVHASLLGLGGAGMGDAGQSAREWPRRDQPLDFALPPWAPGDDGLPWCSGPQELASLRVELGELARLALATEGFGSGQGLSVSTSPEAALPQPPMDGARRALAGRAPEPHLEPEPRAAPAAPMPIEARRHGLSSAALARIEPVHPEPVQIDPAFLQSLANLELSAVQEPTRSSPQPPSGPAPPASTSPIEKASGAPSVAASRPADPEPSSSIPARVTEPLPMMLYGVPPGRGKRSQIFSTALRVDLETLIPSTGALPLRPVMWFGPSPSAPVAPEQVAAAPATAGDAEKLGLEARSRSRQAQKPPGRAGDRTGSSTQPQIPDSSALIDSPPGRPGAAQDGTEAKIETGELTLESRPERPPEAKPEPKSEPKLGTTTLPLPLAAPVTSVDLGLPTLQLDPGGRSRFPAPAVVVVVLVMLAAIGAGVYKLSGKNSKQAPAAPPPPVSDVIETGAPLAGASAGWIEDWAPQPPNPKVLRVLSILRGSLPLSDYRMEFEAQIETKALGWVFRALNQKNYYVTKLEVVKPGIEPAVEVVHFAMVDGEEQPRVRVPLPVKVRVDTSYKIRFEALGDRFTTYVQDQKVDEWTDNRIGRGGAGLYRERGESALLQGTVRMTLIAKKK